MKLFFDTSALVKYFHDEEGSELVAELIDTPGHEIWVSDLARVEFLCALHRKMRAGEITQDQLASALAGFDMEWIRFHVQPLAPVVVAEAERLVKQKGPHTPLRTLDAMQYASFTLIAEKDWQFIAADSQLLQAVSADGYTVLNVCGSGGGVEKATSREGRRKPSALLAGTVTITDDLTIPTVPESDYLKKS